MKIICICGIDTGIGKSVVTGLLARHLMDQGKSVITQKLVQTGCQGQADDILLHRRLMGIGWTRDDVKRLTCPYCFPFPCSPHLAAKLVGQTIDPIVLENASNQLSQEYEYLLIEGAGGIMVPLTPELTLLEYIAAQNYPVILVTSPRIGSINHTLLSLEVFKSRNINLVGLVYNLYNNGPREIVHDSLQYFSRSLKNYGFADHIIMLHDHNAKENADWSPLISSLEVVGNSH